jgi:tetratricopeptide (TPR) repeat protein
MLTEEDKRKIEGPFNRALALRDHGYFQGTHELLSGIAESYPFAAVFGVTGAIYKKLADLENAGKCFERAVDLAPRSELASLNLFHTFVQ